MADPTPPPADDDPYGVVEVTPLTTSSATTPLTTSTPTTTTVKGRTDTLRASREEEWVAAHPGALDMRPPAGGVTLGDLQDNPRAAMNRIGQELRRDVSNPLTWASVLSMYYGPKVMNAIWGQMPPTTAETAAPMSPSSGASIAGRLTAAIKTAAPSLGRMAIGYRGMEGARAASDFAQGWRGAGPATGAPEAPAPAAPSAAAAGPRVPPVFLNEWGSPRLTVNGLTADDFALMQESVGKGSTPYAAAKAISGGNQAQLSTLLSLWARFKP